MGGCSNIHHGDHTVTSTMTASNSSFNTQNNKWVINISSTPLTKAQEKLPGHGPNYAVVPRFPPIAEHVAVVKQACQKLKHEEAEELCGEVKAVLKNIHPPNQTSQKKRERQ